MDFISNTDLSTMLNNLLDNAVESSKESQEKTISLSLRNANGMDILSIINSCDLPPKESNNRLLTTKEDKSFHGYGTKSIKRIVRRYNGEFEWSYDTADKKFHVTVLFTRQ